jgi:hypothetical protein
MSRRTRDESEWAGLTRYGRSDCVTSCDAGSGCASGASCAPLCDVLYLVDDWPYFLLWRHRDSLSPRGTKPGMLCVLNESADSIRKSACGSRSRAPSDFISWAARSSRSPKSGPMRASGHGSLSGHIPALPRHDRAVRRAPARANRASSAVPRRVRFPCP